MTIPVELSDYLSIEPEVMHGSLCFRALEFRLPFCSITWKREWGSMSLWKSIQASGGNKPKW